MSRSGRMAYVLPLVAAVTVSAFVVLEYRLSYVRAREGQQTLRYCSRLRDGIFDLYQQLNACERFNSSYLLTRNAGYLSEYHRSMEAARKSLAEEESISAKLLPGDLVMDNLFRSARRRIAELDAKLAEYERLGPDSGERLVLRSTPTQAMSRFRASHRSANANLRDMDHAISDSLAQALERRGFLIITGALLSASLLFLAFFRLNLSLSHSRKLLAEVRLAEQRYQLLADRVQEQREEEKGRLARRVHDELGQSLTAAKIDLAMVLRTAESDPQSVPRRVRSAMDSLDSAVLNVRRVSTELRPGILDQMGLEPALEWLVREFGQRTGINIHFQCDAGVALGEKADIVVFRITQEALTNVARHAQASQVKVNGVLAKNTFLLTIEDDGVGFGEDKLNDPHSIGLFGMRERAVAAGGSIAIACTPGRGSLIRISIPVPIQDVSVKQAASA